MTTPSSQVVSPAAAAPPHNGFSLISNDTLLQLYTTMLKCRLLQQRIGIIVTEDGQIGPFAAASQEAAAAGVGLCLLPGDTLAPAPRGFIPSFVKGLPLEAIFDRILSALTPKSAGPRPPYARLKLIPPSLSLATQLDRAIKAAITNKAARNKQIAVVFCGSSSADLLRNAMRQAGKRKLPMLFVCHSAGDDEAICQQTQDCGFPGVTVDADDAVALYRVATEAITHARRGSGPTLIECKPWPHPVSKPGKRRAAGSAILNMEAYLTRKGLFDKKFKSKVTASFRRELDAAMKIN
jgi:pyruvate dehydrogenase E1 component alpha subunit